MLGYIIKASSSSETLTLSAEGDKTVPLPHFSPRKAKRFYISHRIATYNPNQRSLMPSQREGKGGSEKGGERRFV